MSNDIWNARREQLERAAIKAALNLCEHTGANAFSLLIDGTQPTLCVTLKAVGASDFVHSACQVVK